MIYQNQNDAMLTTHATLGWDWKKTNTAAAAVYHNLIDLLCLWCGFIYTLIHCPGTQDALSSITRYNLGQVFSTIWQQTKTIWSWLDSEQSPLRPFPTMLICPLNIPKNMEMMGRMGLVVFPVLGKASISKASPHERPKPNWLIGPQGRPQKQVWFGVVFLGSL